MIEQNWFHDLTTDEARQERATLAQRVIAALGVVCLIVLVGLATNAYAAPVFKSEHGGHPVVLKLLETPCKPKVMAHIQRKIRPEFHADMRAAKLTYGGADWDSCWIAVDGHVYSIDEEGAPLQPIPLRAFNEEGV
jgi:hypothetical protein